MFWWVIVITGTKLHFQNSEVKHNVANIEFQEKNRYYNVTNDSGLGRPAFVPG